MTYTEIQAFLAVCHSKNITRAAEALYISQSALSNRIRTLEMELGCRLLIRGKGRHEITLTEEGREFYELALQYRDITEKMYRLGTASCSKPLRVSSINSLGSYLLPQVYALFIERYPGADLDIQDMDTPQALKSLERCTTDIAFGTGNVKEPGIETFPVVREKMWIACSADSFCDGTLSVSDLDMSKELVNNWFDEINLWHDETFGSDGTPLMRLAIMTQLEFFLSKPGHWAFVPYSAARGLMTNSKIRCIRPEFSVPDRIIYCLCRSGCRQLPEIRGLLNCLQNVVHTLDPSGENISLIP